MKAIQKCFQGLALGMIASVVDAGLAFAQATAGNELGSLESQLGELEVPANLAPASVTREKLYSVQSRYNPLKNRWGTSIGVAQNLAGNSFLTSQQVNLDFRYHFNDRWSLSLGGAYGFNSLTQDARQLFQNHAILPDAAYVKYRAQLLPTFNLFYGKFRLSMDRVLYFDHYVAAGPGLIATQLETTAAGVVDTGLVFWTGKSLDFRIGFQNAFFNEKRVNSRGFEHHLLGHIAVGYTWGADRTTRSTRVAQVSGAL